MAGRGNRRFVAATLLLLGVANCKSGSAVDAQPAGAASGQKARSISVPQPRASAGGDWRRSVPSAWRHRARSDSTFGDRELARAAEPVALASAWRAAPPRATSGQCWQRFEPVPAAQIDDAGSAFELRNQGWKVSRRLGVDRFSGFVADAGYSRRAGEVGEPATITHLALLQRVRAFARQNADLLGLLAGDFDLLEWKLGADGKNARTLVGWSGTAVAEVPTSRGFAPLSRRVRIDYTFHRDGVLVSLRVRTSPAVELCSKPALSAEAVRRVPGLVGKELGSADFSGRPFSAGAVRAEDIQKVELTVDEHRQAELLEYRLVYRVTVHRNGMPWAFIIDAMTGEVQRIDRRFST